MFTRLFSVAQAYGAYRVSGDCLPGSPFEVTLVAPRDTDPWPNPDYTTIIGKANSAGNKVTRSIVVP